MCVGHACRLRSGAPSAGFATFSIFAQVSATSISTTLLGSAYGSISEANTIGASVEQLLDAAVAHGCVAVTEQTETSEASGGSSHTRVAVTRQDSSMSFVSPAIEAGIEPVGDPALATPASVVASIRYAVGGHATCSSSMGTRATYITIQVLAATGGALDGGAWPTARVGTP